MYLQWEYDDDAQDRIEARDWSSASVSPVLTGEGDNFEFAQLEQLVDEADAVFGLDDTDTDDRAIKFTRTWEDDSDIGRDEVQGVITDVANSELGRTVIHQPHLSGQIGAYPVAGKADALLLEPTNDGLAPTLYEIKSSSEQKVHHRYQATIYAILLEQYLDAAEEVTAPDAIPVKIITPENDVRGDDPEGFDTAPYRAKLELKLGDGGSFDQTILDTDFEQTMNRIARRCSGCEYEPFCLTLGAENKGLELLGLQAGTQQALHELGIDDIEDFANLFEHDPEGGVHWDYGGLTPCDEGLAQQVRQEADITNLQKRAQIAYRFLAEIDDDYGRDGPDFFAHPLRGTGNALPQDAHGELDVDWGAWGGPDYPSESLVRVYLYVQQDFAQDRVTLLSAYIECSLSGRSRTVTELPDDLPLETGAKQAEENRLFSQFFEQLADEVDRVSPDWSNHPHIDIDLDDDHGFLHLYLYSDTQRDALMDAIRRHPTAEWQRPIRTLLGLRPSIDQEMVSLMQEDFRRRWALRFPGLGSVQSVGHFLWNGDFFDWRAPVNALDDEDLLDEEEVEEISDDGFVQLHRIFEAGLFDGTVRYYPGPNMDHSQQEPAWTQDDRRLGRHIYLVQYRETDQIPIEYIWGRHDRLDPDLADDPDDLDPYLTRTPGSDDPITDTDLALLAQRFARSSHHIERTIEANNRYANDQFVTKEPIELAELADFSFAPRSLDDVCIEYQRLEYQTTKKNLEDYYRQPLEERVDSGASLLFECTNVDTDDHVIEGNLLLSNREEYDPDVHDGLTGGAISVTDDDFMVLTRLDDHGDRPEAYRLDDPDDPSSIGNSTTVIISDIDEEDGTITIAGTFHWGWPWWGEYTVRHRGWSNNPDDIDAEWETYVAEGEQYVLDPNFDQIPQERAFESLQHAFDAPVRRWLRQIYNGRRDAIPIDHWDGDAIQEYIQLMAVTVGLQRPNTAQRDLVGDVDNGLVMLQGPPGTGKTKFTVAPTLLSRAYAAIQHSQSFRGVVSAVSHTAVNEALEGTVDLDSDCPPGTGANEVAFIRVMSSAGQSINDPRVETINYNADDNTAQLEDLYNRYFADDRDTSSRVVFFSTPTSLRGLFNRMIGEVGDFDYDEIEDFLQSQDSSPLDLAIVDEASMMDLPLFLLVGSYVNANGQVILVGDHRQMQPIQKHDWEEEDREPIEQHVPFLSALDFIRYLRGETDLEYFDRPVEVPDDPDETLPVHRLNVTYRLPQESADMHTDLFYEDDDINLVSASDRDELPDVDGPAADILNTDDRVTLLVHNENQSQKTNAVEQALIAEVLNAVDICDPDNENPADEEVTAGVVVPFRAQRRDVIGFVPPEAAVDTVERFQGGERDLMILSMTASDRGYISQISEFLLEPNRFNVGASRMKQKVVIIASAGLFEESSDDIETFEEQKAWINFYQAMGDRGDLFETFELQDLISPEIADEFLDPIHLNEPIRMYSGYQP